MIDFRSAAGQQITLWSAPSHSGGRCYWWNQGSGCPPAAPVSYRRSRSAWQAHPAPSDFSDRRPQHHHGQAQLPGRQHRHDHAHRRVRAYRDRGQPLPPRASARDGRRLRQERPRGRPIHLPARNTSPLPVREAQELRLRSQAMPIGMSREPHRPEDHSRTTHTLNLTSTYRSTGGTAMNEKRVTEIAIAAGLLLATTALAVALLALREARQPLNRQPTPKSRQRELQKNRRRWQPDDTASGCDVARRTDRGIPRQREGPLLAIRVPLRNPNVLGAET